MKKVFFLICMALSIDAYGQTDKDVLTNELSGLNAKCENPANCSGEEIKKQVTTQKKLDSLTDAFKFGMAIGFEKFKSPYVVEAETVGANRIVRVVDSQEYRPSLWLETHYIWDGFADKKLGLTHSAPGFYVGARLLGPDSQVFEAFSLGLLWSFKRTRIGNLPPDGQVAESINIGIGRVWHKTKVLADGISEGAPLPADYTEVKFNKRDEVSWMLMVSVGF